MAAKSSRVGIAVVAIGIVFLRVSVLPARGCLPWSCDPTAAPAPCRCGVKRARSSGEGIDKQKERVGAGDIATVPRAYPHLEPPRAQESTRWTGRRIEEATLRPQVVLAAGEGRGLDAAIAA